MEIRKFGWQLEESYPFVSIYLEKSSAPDGSSTYLGRSPICYLVGGEDEYSIRSRKAV